MKNIVISAMGSVLAASIVPWSAVTDMRTKTGIFTGVFVLLIIFLLFSGELAEKRRSKEKRVQKIRDIITHLRGAEGGGNESE